MRLFKKKLIRTQTDRKCIGLSVVHGLRPPGLFNTDFDVRLVSSMKDDAFIKGVYGDIVEKEYIHSVGWYLLKFIKNL